MKEKLSAMLDGDVDEATAHALFTRLKHDKAFRDEWDAYCLVGDSIRGDAPPELEGFTERVMARLEDEPTILVPSVRKNENEAAYRSWRHHVLPLAASVMGVLAIGGLVAFLSHDTSPAPVVASVQVTEPSAMLPVIHSRNNGAAITVFIEPAGAGDKARGAYPGGGAVNAFERISGGRRITAIGEVPAPIVQRVAEAIEESK
jgi:sigma-E factor negative regulatory protein RseA